MQYVCSGQKEEHCDALQKIPHMKAYETHTYENFYDGFH